MAYVDLNPIRAGIAETPETSDFTSVKDRIEDRAAAEAECSVASVQCSAGTSQRTNDGSPGELGNSRSNQIASANRNRYDDRVEHGDNAGWLAPIGLKSPRKKVREKSTARRAGNKGCLPMSLDQYLQLLDWTSRQIRRDKAGRIPAECAPILERLECSAETWLDFVKNFRRRFRNEAGLPRNRTLFRTSRRQSRTSESHL